MAAVALLLSIASWGGYGYMFLAFFRQVGGNGLGWGAVVLWFFIATGFGFLAQLARGAAVERELRWTENGEP